MSKSEYVAENVHCAIQYHYLRHNKDTYIICTPVVVFPSKFSGLSLSSIESFLDLSQKSCNVPPCSFYYKGGHK